MVSNACPYHCMYCSEGVTVVDGLKTFDDSDINLVLERMVEYAQYGAEAFFFDDSIFRGGNVGLMINFCREWINCVKRQPGRTPLKLLCSAGK